MRTKLTRKMTYARSLTLRVVCIHLIVVATIMNDIIITKNSGRIYRLRKEDPVSDAIHVIRGYTSAYPLLDDEITALPTLIACRLVCTCVLGAYSYSQDPGNDYLLATQKLGWDALEALVAEMGAPLNSRIRLACSHTP